MQIPDSALKPELERLGYDWDTFVAQRLFCPHWMARTVNLHNSGLKLVHYTATETVLKIAENREVWLRNVRCMNDFTEVQWGARLVERFFDSEEAKPFWNTLEELQPGIREQSAANYRGWVQDFVNNTFVFCVSEHDPGTHPIGRLSMWRAYAQTNGCALILNAKPFYQVSDALGAYSFPVCYKSAESATEMFRSIVRNVVDSVDLLRTYDTIDGFVFQMLEYHATCLKHPAFEEEQEWRVIHRPVQNPNTRMKSEVRSVKGVVQKVFKLPMLNVPEENLIGIEPKEIMEQLLLGPSLDSAVARDAAVEKLQELGFADPDQIVRETRIPLRT